LIPFIAILFLGCMARVSHTFEKIDPNNPVVKHKHFTMIAPDETPIKWEWIRTNYYDNEVTVSHYLQHFNKDKKPTEGIWKGYSLQILTYSAENEKGRDKKLQYYLKALESIKNRDEQYLKEEYLEWTTWKKRGIVSAEYGSVNKHPAIVADTHTKYRDTDKYSREYFFLTYSKTGKLKAYIITISVDIDKPNADDPELLVEYSFEDMLKRSQRSLDSFVASDEDF
ncbi:MAG: hypothetical protein M0Q25_08830, partial [Sulfurospirillaceae bacterium]|nr:hypothetical protein [Sulfurospirillaceae bacterium]